MLKLNVSCARLLYNVIYIKREEASRLYELQLLWSPKETLGRQGDKTIKKMLQGYNVLFKSYSLKKKDMSCVESSFIS